MKAFTITSILAAACVLAAASPAAESQALAKAPAQAAAGIPKQDPQLIKGQLPNGLTYFIRPNAEPKGRFSIRLRVNTGSLNETVISRAFPTSWNTWCSTAASTSSAEK